MPEFTHLPCCPTRPCQKAPGSPLACRVPALFWGGLAAMATCMLAIGPAGARGGGGHSFSGGGHSGGFGGGFHGSLGGGHYYGSSGGSSPIGLLFIIAIIIIVIVIKSRRGQAAGLGAALLGMSDGTMAETEWSPLANNDQMSVNMCLDRLRQYDPNFSQIAFEDFIYTLYGRAHESRGRGDLADLSPYLSQAAIAALQPTRPDIQSVSGVIVGASRLMSVSDPNSHEMVNIVVRYETNYTETTAGAPNQSYYAVEQWEFQRRRDVLSPEPEQVAALHCPKCGGSLEKRSDGACAHCGVKVVSGDFHWYVTGVSTLERDPRGPLLTTDVPEVGTDLPTRFDPGLTAAHQALEAAGNFSWDRAQERFGHIFMGVQQAWTMLKPDLARPFETDNIYDMHRYWIEAYQRQNLRNVLDNITIESITPVKIQSDRFYDAMTVRIFANMLDYTVNAQGQGVCGSPNRPRRFSEYWTFIRRQGSKENARDNNSCPNCGAPLKINMAGACEYCGGKITRGDFDWVLSRIEQDEAYVG